jgi:hypothetical protein
MYPFAVTTAALPLTAALPPVSEGDPFIEPEAFCAKANDASNRAINIVNPTTAINLFFMKSSSNLWQILTEQLKKSAAPDLLLFSGQANSLTEVHYR